MQVLIDLRVFTLFYIVLILMLSLIFDVISPNDATEYKNVSRFTGDFLTTLRLSLGSFDFAVLADNSAIGGYTLDPIQHVIYWACWVFMILFSLLIFLNFIIAEVSNSYAIVR